MWKITKYVLLTNKLFPVVYLMGQKISYFFI